jgi:hypothetical protein
MWNQIYNPLDNAALSTIAAALPVITLLVLIASGKVKAHIAAIIALIVANLVNAVANWILIYGHFGAPAMGVRGSAWATLTARIFMAGWLFVIVVRSDGNREPPLRDTTFGLDLSRQRRLFALGLPAAGQAVLEVGVKQGLGELLHPERTPTDLDRLALGEAAGHREDLGGGRHPAAFQGLEGRAGLFESE